MQMSYGSFSSHGGRFLTEISVGFRRKEDGSLGSILFVKSLYVFFELLPTTRMGAEIAPNSAHVRFRKMIYEG